MTGTFEVTVRGLTGDEYGHGGEFAGCHRFRTVASGVETIRQARKIAREAIRRDHSLYIARIYDDGVPAGEFNARTGRWTR